MRRVSDWAHDHARPVVLGWALMLSFCAAVALALTAPVANPKAVAVTFGAAATKVTAGCHLSLFVCDAATCGAASPAPCYVGAAGVTTATGLPVQSGQTFSMDVQAVWVVSTAATCTARVLTASCSK